MISQKQLTITSPTITVSKQYDGLNTAAVTATGTLSGRIGSEVVEVNASATYDTAATGTGKTITAVYSLVGSDSGNYLAPVNYTTATGAITKKQLTIATPTLTLLKVFDGNNTAVVTAGTLSGKIGSENVTINTAVATYDTIAVATGKTITVVYTITGSDSGNYLAPVNYTTTNGAITGIRRNRTTDINVNNATDNETTVVTTTISTTTTDNSSSTNPIVVTTNPVITQVSTNSEIPVIKISGAMNTIKKQLKLGVSGADVKLLQILLSNDSTIYPEALTTGYFGNLTQKAVQKFQEKYNIVSKGNAGYGQVGPKTKAKLIELFGN